MPPTIDEIITAADSLAALARSHKSSEHAPPPPPNPTIINFTATPGTINTGESSTLDAVVANAISLTLDGSLVTLPWSVAPISTKTFTLIANGMAGTVPATAQASVTVLIPAPPPQPSITNFTAFPLTIAPGQASTLNATVANAVSLAIDGVTIPSLPQVVVPQASKTYTLSASGAPGTTPASATTTVTVNPVPTASDPVLIGSHIGNRPFRLGPADKANRVDLDAAIAATPPWSWFGNPVTQEFASSANGVRPTRWLRIHPWGNFAGLYKAIPRLNQDGTVSNLGSKAPGDDVLLNIVPYIKAHGLRGGKRGFAITTPYMAWKFHDRKMSDGSLSMNSFIPHMIGLDIAFGHLMYRMRDGEVKIVYTMTNPKAPHDWSFDPSNRDIVIVANTEANQLVEITHRPSFSERVLMNVHRPTSVRCRNDGVMCVVSGSIAAPTTNTVFIIPKGMTVPSFSFTVAHAFYVDFTSTGNFRILGLDCRVHEVNPVTGTIAQHSSFGGGLQTWVSLSIDRNGACGPKDEMLASGMHFFDNGGAYIFRTTNNVWQNYLNTLPTGAGQATVGDTQWCVDLVGHYGWSGEYSPHSCEIYWEGASDGQGSIICARPATHPAEDAYDHNTFTAGRKIIQMGCGPGTLYGSVPSLTCQMADQGWSLIGVTADWFSEKTFQEQQALVQGGFLGSFPRPFIKGRDLYRIMYFLNRSSQKFLRLGGSHMAALKTFCTLLFGQELPAISQHEYEPNVMTDVYLDCVVTGNTLSVKGRNQWGDARTIESSVQVQAFLDEGLPHQINLGILSSPWTMTLNPMQIGQHSVRAVWRSGGSQFYVGRAGVVVA